jgi:hypothetical protein
VSGYRPLGQLRPWHGPILLRRWDGRALKKMRWRVRDIPGAPYGPFKLPLPVLAEVVGEEVDALPWLARRLPETKEEAEELFRDYWHQNRQGFERLCCDYHSGERYALLDAIRLATELNIPLPEWVAAAYCSTLDGYEQAAPGTRTLADAFGVYRAKSVNLNTARRRDLYQWFIHKRYKTLKRAGLRTAENATGAPTIWEQISEELKNPKLLESPDNPSPDSVMFAAFQLFPNQPQDLSTKQIQELYYEAGGGAGTNTG